MQHLLMHTSKHKIIQEKFIARTDNDEYPEDSTGLMIKRFISKYNKIKYAKLL
jgi:hypothetical protein